jgi:hypothetical protein
MPQPAVRLDNFDHHVLPTHMRSTPYTKQGLYESTGLSEARAGNLSVCREIQC